MITVWKEVYFNLPMRHSIVIQELVFVVERYVFPQRPPYDTKLKLENYIISNK